VARTARDPRADAATAIARLRSTSGRWIAITGSTLDGPDGHVAVVLQQASLGQMLPAAAAWFRLTKREADVLRLTSQGGTAREMSRTLQMSEHTLNDHLTTIYRKANVRGRDELLALLT
jgi:DNA-binding CsgD family transcriptional regulator